MQGSRSSAVQLSLPMGNTDPWLLTTGHHPSLTRQVSATGRHVISAEWSTIASPRGVELQPLCLGARDTLNWLRRCL